MNYKIFGFCPCNVTASFRVSGKYETEIFDLLAVSCVTLATYLVSHRPLHPGSWLPGFCHLPTMHRQSITVKYVIASWHTCADFVSNQ